MSESIYQSVREFSLGISAEAGEYIYPAVSEVLCTPTIYKNAERVYWDGPGGTARPGAKPFFNSSDDQRHSITPYACPAFVRFPSLVGSVQGLNGEFFWERVLSRSPEAILSELKNAFSCDDIQEIAQKISYGNKNLYNPFLVLSSAGIIYGSDLERIVTRFDKTYNSYSAILSAVSRYEIAQSPEEIRTRFIEQFGTYQQSGILTNATFEVMKRCPAPKLTDAILRTAGEFIQSDAHWAEYSKIVFN